jgi:hypothetical protein
LSREFFDDRVYVHYTVHPAKDQNDFVFQNATDVIPLVGDKPASSYQRHRFDWTGKQLRFYQNSELVLRKTQRIPSTTDVLMSVRLIAIYHNTTASEAGLDATFNLRCDIAGGPSERTVCSDTLVESGEVIPSSVAVATVPLPFDLLTMLSIVLGIMLVI